MFKRLIMTIVAIALISPATCSAGHTSQLSAESIVHSYLTAYRKGKIADMDKVAAGEGRYSRIVARKLPHRLNNFIIFDSDAICADAINKKVAGRAKKNGWKFFTIGANDSEGHSCSLVVYTKHGKVVYMENEPSEETESAPQAATPTKVVAKGSPLTRTDRLQMIHDLRLSGDDGYLEFFDEVSYKGYTRADPCFDNIEGLGAATYWHKVKGKWKVILETQDTVTRAEFRKLGIPSDVQKEVFANCME